MTDYDAQIAHLKMVGMRELRKRANAPFSVPQGDLPGFYEETLNAVVGPFAQRLMAALIARDQWEKAAEERQAASERWIVSCHETQDMRERERADYDAALELKDARIAELEKPMSDAELREYARGMGWVLRAS
jgi:hypothetical protein